VREARGRAKIRSRWRPALHGRRPSTRPRTRGVSAYSRGSDHEVLGRSSAVSVRPPHPDPLPRWGRGGNAHLRSRPAEPSRPSRSHDCALDRDKRCQGPPSTLSPRTSLRCWRPVFPKMQPRREHGPGGDRVVECEQSQWRTGSRVHGLDDPVEEQEPQAHDHDRSRHANPLRRLTHAKPHYPSSGNTGP
jgi:hypothetical protein